MKTLVRLSAISLLAACGTGGDSGPHGTGPRAGYPEGPFGVTKSSTLEDLELLRPDGGPLFMNEIYADGHNQLMLITTTAGWCVACREEQGALEDLNDRYRARGLYVLVVVFEDDSFGAADAAFAASWKQQYSLTVEVVADPTFLFGAYYDVSQTPMNMIVDVNTMQILKIMTGWDPGAVEAIIEARL